MAEKSTAVKRVAVYDVEHEGGARTGVLEVAFIDPAKPEVLHLQRDLRVSAPIQFVTYDFKV